MNTGNMRLLNDADVQKFICDGFLVLPPEVAAPVHKAAYDKLQLMMAEEYNPGNNILPRVPELQQILDAPGVHGALTSILGSDYVLHPHRYCHSNLPGIQTPEGPQVGAGSTSFVGWHQDSHSPLSRPRHHYPRYAMILYYPQDTPPELGPTQLIPGTQYNRQISDADRARGLQASGAAGTCVLVHFDMAHGGSLNVGNYCRHMVKFVFARAAEPENPSWNCRDRTWKRPADVLTPHHQEIVWQHIWRWMCGDLEKSNSSDSIKPNIVGEIARLTADNDLDQRLQASNKLGDLGPKAAAAVPALINCLSGPEALRQNAIYALGAIGAPAIPALLEHLQSASEDGWNEGAVVLEDSAYALSIMGKIAIPALENLLTSENEWIRINAIFALGEIGTTASISAPLFKSVLADASHKIVRTALDALGQMGPDAAPLLADITQAMQAKKPGWDERLIRDWSGGDQVRVNASLALLRLGTEAPNIEAALAASLGDPCGYVDGFVLEALLRLQTPTAMQQALHHLQTHRWDDTLIRNVRTF